MVGISASLPSVGDVNDAVYRSWMSEAPEGVADNVDLLRSITDPEHPVSLEQLRVVNPDDIKVSGNRVLVYLTPTIPHCSMSTLIGMLLQSY
jgi:metal-sulfur cluster biosynthetic enzyme